MVRFSDERNKDLFDAYKSTIKRLGEHAKYMTRRSIVQLTVDSPAKRFYVTPETALKMFSCIIKTGSPGRLKGVTEAKFKDLYEIYAAKKIEFPYLSKYALADMAINSPAPKFYLEWEAALSIIYEMEKQK